MIELFDHQDRESHVLRINLFVFPSTLTRIFYLF